MCDKIKSTPSITIKLPQKPKTYHDDALNIVEVDQNEVKKALKALIASRNQTIGKLYEAHEKFNNDKFGGVLVMPVITIERMDNRTLANYTRTGYNRIGVDNHIHFNENFVALNSLERVFLTLQHKMIHQWQDQVLYATLDRKPKDWHNKDFREMALKIGIPCEGKHCGTGAVIMPKAKSYNRKFICGCIASNGFPLTIWSTREVSATCDICEQPFTEVKKNRGETIPVTSSHINLKSGDIVQKTLELEGLDYFKRFQDKEELDNMVANITEGVPFKQGHYQKHHTMYAQGYRYWVAWKTAPEFKEQPARQVVKKPAVKGGT